MRNFVAKLTILILLTVFFFTFFSPVLAISVVINEILPHPSSENSDWIELYKTDSAEIDMSSWKIEDSTGVVKTLAEGTKFASSSSFMQFSLSNRLNNGGDGVKLKDENGVLVDEKSYNQDPGIGISLGRYPDGADFWGILVSASPNSPNSDFVPTSTSTPTPTPTSTPLPKPTSKPTATPKPSEMVKTQEKEVVLQPLSTNDPADSNLSVGKSSGSGNILETDDNLSILGENDEATDNSGMKEASEDARETKPLSAGFLIIGLIIVGCAMLGVSVFLSLREAKRVK